MVWSYENLWILLLQRNIKKSDLVEMAGITSNAIAQMSRNEEVTMKTLRKLCIALECNIQDIVQLVPEKNVKKASASSKTSKPKSGTKRPRTKIVDA